MLCYITHMKKIRITLALIAWSCFSLPHTATKANARQWLRLIVAVNSFRYEMD